MVPEALKARLKILEDEILRLSKLASESSDRIEQDKYWSLALDLQREARSLRTAAKSTSETEESPRAGQSDGTRCCDLRHSRFVSL